MPIHTFPPAQPTPTSVPAESARIATKRPDKQVQKQLRRAGIAGGTVVGGGQLLDARVLVVNQKAKLFGTNSDYAVFDGSGLQVGAVREVRQHFVKKAMSTRSVQNQMHRFQVLDGGGEVLLTLLRPQKLYKSRMIVAGADGAPMGQIIQKTLGLLGRVRFDLEASGRTVGTIKSDGWDSWNFGVYDDQGGEVARISKELGGLAQDWFTRKDHYIVQIHRALDDPLHSLVIATALAVDVALHPGGS